MKIAISSDEYHPLIEVLLREVKDRKHDPIYFGPQQEEKSCDWTEVTLKAVREVVEHRADEGIVLCWTGTGCTLIANKVKGIRAALCIDAETAKGARIWNHANVLGLSLRLTSPAVLREILTAWLDTPYSSDAWNLSQIKQIHQLEQVDGKFDFALFPR